VILADFLPMQNGEHAPLDTRSEGVARPEPDTAQPPPAPTDKRPAEMGGRAGPDPTRFGDWEKNGRCIDF